MFTEKRLDDIRARVKVSTLLSAQEKSDWLGLLELMNDKQLGELEEILASESPPIVETPEPVKISPLPNANQATPPPLTPVPPLPTMPPPTPAVSPTTPTPAPPPMSSVPTPPPVSIPPLTHIANIPSDVATPNSFQQKSSGLSPQPIAPLPKPTPKPVRPKAPPIHTGPTTPYVIEHPEDLKLLTPDSLRVHDLQSIVDTMKKTIAEHGYFAILQLLEASSLYESYIQAGELRLKGQDEVEEPDKDHLTQSEFEFMTDLMGHIRFNRW